MRSLVVGTAGHIDHGKSALVQALTGIDPDRLKEEKARGITIELGFAHAQIGDLDVSFVDVPGHERFVRTMLAGAGGIDAVMLVVAANESVMPQTREHLAICRLLGVTRGLVALTKVDVVDEDTRDVAAIEVRELVAGTFLERAPIVPVSARSGEGLDALRRVIASPAGPAGESIASSLARLPVDRSFLVKGFGTVVTGTLVSGRIAVGDELELLPSGARVRVRGVQVHGRDVNHADAPNRVAVNLAGPGIDAAARGATLATPGALAATRYADVRIDLSAPGALWAGRADPVPLRHGAAVRVYHGTSEIGARVAIAATRASSSAPWTPAGIGDAGVSAPPGGQALARLRFVEPAVLTRFDRLVLRTASPALTIGGAVVLDPAPSGQRLRRPATLGRFHRLDESAQTRESSAPLRVWIDEAGTAGLDAGALVKRAGLGPPQVTALTAALVREGAVVEIKPDGRFVGAQSARRLAAEAALRKPAPAPSLDDAERMLGARIESAILEARWTPPDVSGLASATGVSPAEVERLVRLLTRAGRLTRLGDLVYHPDVLEALKKDIKGDGTPVDVGTFKARYGVSRKYAIPLLEWLDRERVTRRVGDRRVVL